MAEIILLHPHVGHLDAMRSNPAPPLSLLHAAACAAGEFDVQLIDRRIHPDWKTRLAHALSGETLLVGVTAYTGPMIRTALEMSRFVKATSDVPVLWGGIHASLMPEQTIANENVDMVIRGEGEFALLKLARAIRNGSSLDGIDGLCFKEKGSVELSPPATFVDLEAVPEPAYHIVDMQRYMALYKGDRSFYFQSSRGCPLACTYCFNGVYNERRWRAMSAEETLKRISSIKERFHPGDIYFIDDNFFIDMDRGRGIMEGMAAIGIPWQVQGVDITSIGRMSDGFLGDLERCGCRRITIGVESGSERIRRLMGKEGSTADVITAIRRLRAYDIVVYCSFMAGLPGETVEEIRETVDLMFRLFKESPNVRTSPVYVYTPFPGTEMYRLAVKEGFSPSEYLEGWSEIGRWDKSTFSHQGLSGKRRGGLGPRALEDLYHTSLFLDRKAREYTLPRLWALLVGLYRPAARLRVRHLFFSFMPERIVRRFVQRFVPRSGLGRDH